MEHFYSDGFGVITQRIKLGPKSEMNLPDNLRHKITFSVIRDANDTTTAINITKSLPEIAGKKITLSYSPATSADEAVINSYLPKPHADGTPIQPSELPSSLPAYLISVKPELRIDGQLVATGTSVGLAAQETFTMTFITPYDSPQPVTNEIIAGGYFGIAIDSVRISENQINHLKAKLETTKTKLEAQDFSNIARDDILGDLLYATALTYFVDLDAMDYIQTKTMRVVSNRLPSDAIFSLELSPVYIFGVPRSVRTDGLIMDVDRNLRVLKALDNDNDRAMQFMLMSGATSSGLEHSVPEETLSTGATPARGISAIKALQIADEQGIPIYTISQSNISVVLPQLQVNEDVKRDIQNAVNAGEMVNVPKQNISFNSWSGCGYIIVDTATGGGSYRISGGFNGASVSLSDIAYWLMSLVSSSAEAASSPYKDIFGEGPVKDQGCIMECGSKCGLVAGISAIFELYANIWLFLGFIACVLLLKNYCAILLVIATVIGIILLFEHMRECRDKCEKDCPLQT